MVRKIFSSLVLRGLILLSRFILMLIMTKYLEVRDVGIYGILLAMIMVVVPFCGLNYLSYSKRLILKNNQSEWPSILRDHFGFHLLTLVIVVPASLLIFFFGYIDGKYVIWFYLLLLGDYVCDEAYRLLVTMKRATEANLVQFLKYGFWVYFLAAVFYFSENSRSLETLFLYRGVSSILGIVLALWCLRDLDWKKMLCSKIDLTVYKPALKIIGIYFVVNIALRIRMASERIYLEDYGGEELVGVYVLYFGLAIVIKSIVEAALEIHYSPLIVQHLQHKKYKDAHRVFKKLFMASLVVAVALGSLLIMFIDDFLRILNKTDGPYVENIANFKYVIMAYVALLGSDLFGLLLYGNNKDYSLLFVNVVSVILFLTVTSILLKEHGMNAVSFGIMAYAATQAIVIFILHKKNMRDYWKLESATT